MADKRQRRRQRTIMERNETTKEMVANTENLLKDMDVQTSKTTPLSPEEKVVYNKKERELAQRIKNNMHEIIYTEEQQFDSLEDIGDMLNEKTNEYFPDVTVQKTEQRENETSRDCNDCCGCCCNCSRKTWCNIC